jgi:hypothetical protein
VNGLLTDRHDLTRMAALKAWYAFDGDGTALVPSGE